MTSLLSRTDVGALWENYLVVERMKAMQLRAPILSRYFWRTTQQQEIDYREEINAKLMAFEFKFSPRKKSRIPRTFTHAYPEAVSEIISRENYGEVLMGGR